MKLLIIAKMMFASFVLELLLLNPNVIYAQEEEIEYYWGISGVATMIKENIKESKGFGNGGGFQFLSSFSFYKKLLNFSADIGFEWFEDYKPFSQTVAPSWTPAPVDIKEERSSEVMGFPISLGIGLRTPSIPFNRGIRFNFGINSGVKYFFWDWRGIANCTDCESEDVDINAGFYLESSMRMMLFGQRFNEGINFYYRIYQQVSDIDWELGVSYIILSSD